MTDRTRGISPWIVAAGLALALASAAGAAGKGPKISVGDDPSTKQGSPGVVLIEVSDFQ